MSFTSDFYKALGQQSPKPEMPQETDTGDFTARFYKAMESGKEETNQPAQPQSGGDFTSQFYAALSSGSSQKPQAQSTAQNQTGFYTPPEFYADYQKKMDAVSSSMGGVPARLLDNSYKAYTLAQRDLDTIRKEMDTLTASYQQTKDPQLRQQYLSKLEDYNKTLGRVNASREYYQKTSQQYAPQIAAYRGAVNDLNDYIQQQNQEQQQWRSTVRGKSDVAAELQAVKKELEAYDNENPLTVMANGRLDPYREADLRKKLDLLEKEYLYSQNFDAEDVLTRSDFAEKSAYQSKDPEGIWESITSVDGYTDPIYEYINNQNGAREKIDSRAYDGLYSLGENRYQERGLEFMTPQEIAIYNYYYATEGKDSAEQYLSFIQDDLLDRKARGIYEDMGDSDFRKVLYGAEVGWDQFKGGIQSGIKGIFGAGEKQSASAIQRAGAMAREDLADTGWKLPDWAGGASLGQLGYDSLSTAANMAPSVLVSMIPIPGAAAVGTATMGLSSGGNAYQQALNSGYNQKQAMGYGLMVGASESILQDLIGGKLGNIGGKVSAPVKQQLLSNIDNAFARVAVDIGSNMASEFSEEYVQELLDPVFRNIALNEDNQIALYTPEALYSAIMGALQGGLMGSGSAVSSEIARQNYVYSGMQSQSPVGDDAHIVPQTQQEPPEVQKPAPKEVKEDQSPVGAIHESPEMQPPVVTDTATATQTTPHAMENANISPNEGRPAQTETESVGAASAGKPMSSKISRVFENTYKNAAGEVKETGDRILEIAPEIGEYTPNAEGETLHNAAERAYFEGGPDAEYQKLLSKESWTAEDNDTAFYVLEHLRKSGRHDEMIALAKKQRELATSGGQFIQSFAKYSRTPGGAATNAVLALDEYKPNDIARNVISRRDFNTWKKQTRSAILDVASQIENVPEGDTATMREIVRYLAKFRRTTAWAGRSSRLTSAAEKLVNKLDFKTAKDIATAQLSRIPSDYRRRSVGEIAKSLRIMSMLSSLTTPHRNLAGNTAIALVDGLSDSVVGSALDALVSRVTGKRTVAADIRYSGEYLRAATDAAQMASLCAELDIPLDLESDSKYMGGRTRTFSPQGGMVSRFLSAYEKYLRYSLEVSDRFFEGGANAAVRKSLENLGATANLSKDEISALAARTSERRTFKEERKLTRAAQKAKGALNEVGTKNIGLGDFSLPFVGVGSNMAHSAIDFSTGGIGGFYEILKLINDARAGKEVSVMDQRKAVSDAARGITGIGLISLCVALASCGVISISEDEDKDKRGLEQSEGLSGIQMNISGALRAIQGGSGEYQQGDYLLDIGFLQPFDSVARIGYSIAQDESIAQVLQNYPQNSISAVANSLLDMPLMEGLSDTIDLAGSFFEAAANGDFSAVEDSAAKALGTTATSYIPAIVRQAAQTIDPYYRDTSGDTASQQAANQVIAQLPFLSKTLPKKYSGFGEEQRRYAEGEELLGFFSNFLSAGKITKASPSDLSGLLNTLYESTGDAGIYPEYLAPKSFTMDGKTVMISGQEMTETYQSTYGKNIARLYSEVTGSAAFTDLPPKMKVEALKKAKGIATDLAKAAVSEYHVPQETQEATGTGIIDAIVQKHSGLTELRYQEAKSAGFSLVEMKEMAALIDALTPQEGYSSVRDIQKYNAIAESKLSSEDKAEWLRVYMPDSLEQKMDEAQAMDIEAQEFLAMYGEFLENNRRKQETIAEFQEMYGLDAEMAEKLYKIYNGK